MAGKFQNGCAYPPRRMRTGRRSTMCVDCARDHRIE
jgi:hypothetical protein